VKGIVFTEFLEFAEQKIGAEALEEILEACGDDLPTGGAYTAVGTYSCSELMTLVQAISTHSGAAIPQLVHEFGEMMSRSFVALYPQYYNRFHSLFDFLSHIDDYIHVEVKKLYPDAELPEFRVIERSDDRLVIDYNSPRGLTHLAAGLFQGSSDYYREPVRIQHAVEPAADVTARFELSRV
jgi:hypothetical protein